jgi:hypothetical protein
MTDRFQGDPYLTITQDGAEMTFVGGQPVMDPGLENQANISLFTSEGWWGNILEDDPDKKIGSDFEKISKEPITLENLKRLRKSGIAALQSPAFKTVDGFIDNSQHNRTDFRAVVTPPSGVEAELLLSKSGQNWINQKNDPAHLK